MNERNILLEAIGRLLAMASVKQLRLVYIAALHLI